MKQHPMNMTTIPVHPSEQHLPRSVLRIPVGEEGKYVELNGVPLNAPKTWENIIKIFDIWKPNIVQPELDYQI